jgi:diguanylate cyclase (GGDEF)-like protein
MAGRPTTDVGAFLATRFGRRIFALFVACALLPIAALAGLSWLRVTAELRDQSERRLHAASRSAGMRIVERLVGLSETLDRVELGGYELEALCARLRGLAVLERPGRWRPLCGAAAQGEPDVRERRVLAAGGTLLREVGAGSAREIVLLEGRADGRALAAWLRREELFDFAAEDVLPLDGEICLFGSGRSVLHCSLAGEPSPPRLPGERSALHAALWTHAGVDYLAVPWPLFLRARFHHPEWLVLVAEPARSVYAPIGSFRLDLALVTSLTLLLVTFLTVLQIRRRLVPLERLQAGTRALAQGDFAARVGIESDDELGELAGSFNAMAARLDGQFRSLERVIEIDRAVLGAPDEESLARLFLEPIQRLYPCRFALLALLEGDGSARVFACDGEGTRRVAAERLSASEREALLARSEAETIAPDALPPACRAWLPAPAAEVLAVPLIGAGEALGVFLAGHAEAGGARPEQVLYVRQLCGQLVAALRGERLRRQNEALRRFDPLTGLSNRRGFEERLGEALAAAAEGSLLAVARLAVGGLDRIRATFGPEEVERVVRSVGERIRGQALGAAGHFGGGEFGLLVAGAAAEDLARDLHRAGAAIREALAGDERAHLLAARLGAAVHPLDGREGPALLRNADAALRVAGERGGSGLVFYAPEMNEALGRRVRLESDLARAIERQELRLFFQPIVDAATREIVGAEALLRWQHPELGLISPARFVPLAEEIGLIEALGSWTLRSACRSLRGWREAGLPAPRVSVNVSPHQLKGGGLLSEVLGALTGSGLPPSALALELTESALLGEELGHVETLRALHRAGVGLALDDFGTGYSALGYLQRFPFDALKLDRVFVQGVTREPDKRAITEAVLALARELRLEVVAEGVETEEQLRFLRERGCARVQGFLFAEPLPEDAFGKLLAERRDGYTSDP